VQRGARIAAEQLQHLDLKILVAHRLTGQMIEIDRLFSSDRRAAAIIGRFESNTDCCHVSNSCLAVSCFVSHLCRIQAS